MLAPALLVLTALATGPSAWQDGSEETEGPTAERIEAALEDLEGAFRSGDTKIRVQALDRASDVVVPPVIEEIAGALKDRVPEVQAAAIQALRWMDHPDALEALHDAALTNRSLQKSEEFQPALLRAIGQHASPSSVRLLSHKPFSSPHYQAERARILALGRIRSRDAVEALLGMMRSSSRRDVDRHMGSFRMSLMVLTGTDQGPASAQWVRWWKASKKDFVVSPIRSELPRPTVMKWTEYWGLEDDYGRTRRREDRGEND